MNLNEGNCYRILGVEQSATSAEIEAAFSHLRSIYSPTGVEPNPDTFEHVRQAYEVLRDPERRRRFDALLIDVIPIIRPRLQLSAQQLAVIDEPQMVYALVELLSPVTGEQARTSLNVCVVVDRSTSMRGDRLRLVKQALRLLLPNLSAGDNLSVVVFSDRAEIALSAREIGEHIGQLDWIEEVEAAGGTEIVQGLLAGIGQLHKTSLEDHNNQLVLLTDGRTYGDEAACLQLAADAAAQGIAIHAFGIGVDWDDEFLDALAAPSGGLVDYLDTPGKIVTSLQRRMKGLGETHARNVNLRIQWPPSASGFDSLRLTPYAKELKADGDKLLLGDLEGGNSLAFLLAFSVAPQPVETRIRVPLLLSAEVPGRAVQTFREQIDLLVVVDPPPYEPPPEVIRAVRLLTLYRMNERAWQEASLGQTDTAVQRIRYLATRLLESGEPELARQAELEALQLGRTGHLSPTGRKAIKYGTRALTRKTLQLDWNDSV